MTEINIIQDILEKALKARPENEFIASLLNFYNERGGLSKKQMEGLYNYAKKIPGIAPGKLATLEAILKKRPGWQKSEKPQAAPEEKPDEEALADVAYVLEKNPAHKRVLFFKMKLDQNEKLTPTEVDEIKRFKKLFEEKFTS